MKRLYTLLLLGWSVALHAQTKADRHAPVLYFKLTDSTLVSGKVVRQDSATIVVEKRGGELTYLQPSQVVRTTTTRPAYTRPTEGSSTTVTSFSLRDGATVTGQVMRETPVAVVVRLPNGTLSYIDPADILSQTTVVAADPAQPGAFLDAIGSPYLLNNRTAYMPRGGTVYYRNAYLIRNEFEAGIANGWSVGIVYNPSVSTLYDVSSYISNAVYSNTNYGTQLYTRIGIPIGNSIRLGAVIATHLRRVNEFNGAGFTQATRGALTGQVLLSFGKPSNNVTLGYTFRLDDVVLGLYQPGKIIVGTVQALSPKLSVVSDNVIAVRRDFSGPMAQLSAALRIRGGAHAFDLGVASFVNTNLFYDYGARYYTLNYNVYPYVGYNVQFGRRW